ncbi:tetrathionate reductase subunit B precursor [Peptococcaceae bacterium CEB3]|nr:tetrathionate reductase subunit B precursor [Peptococcaceae bacterium CEB3]
MAENERPAQEKEGRTPDRRGFLKKALTLGGVLGAAGAFGALGIGKALAAGRAGEESQPGGMLQADGEALTWQGYADPNLNKGDGWQDWSRLLNPAKLPIYHDNFAQIKAARPKHHWVLVVDLRKCTGCQSCVVACKSENNIPVGNYRTWVDVGQVGKTVAAAGGDVVTDEGSYVQEVKVRNIPKLCNHCDNPPCVTVCPVKATFKRADGPVLVDPRLCIGCGTCVNACPYDARYLNPISHTADKCTLCVERIDAGLLPACVTTCVGRARVFGDLLDPKSEVSQLLAHYPAEVRKPEIGTKPQVFYIGLNGELATADNPASQRLIYTYTMNTNSTAYQKLNSPRK